MRTAAEGGLRRTGGGRRRGLWFAVVALAVAAGAFLTVAVGGIGENLVYYWTPTDLAAAGPKALGAAVRLGGQVVPGSVVRGSGASHLEFDVSDGRSTVHVRSAGVPPQMFREGVGVVVEGTLAADGAFEGSRLLVSHDNEYQAPASGAEVEARHLIETTRGLEESRVVGRGDHDPASAGPAGGAP